jgi:hypothetical protein
MVNRRIGASKSSMANRRRENRHIEFIDGKSKTGVRENGIPERAIAQDTPSHAQKATRVTGVRARAKKGIEENIEQSHMNSSHSEHRGGKRKRGRSTQRDFNA